MRGAEPAPRGEGWYICYFSNYVSDAFIAPDGTGSFRAMTGAYGQFVASKYGRPFHAVPNCVRFLSQRLAENTLLDDKNRTFNDGSRTIMTGWKYNDSGAPANAAVAAAPSAAPGPGPLRSYCYTGETSDTDPYNSAGRRVFFTAIISVERDAVRRDLFRKYVEKKYGVLHDSYPTCAGGYDPQNQMIHFMERDVANAKEHGSTVVMTEWTPDKHEALMAEAEKNPAPAPFAASAPKKSPAPVAAQSAYEKALAAQRPQNVTQAQLEAASKQAAPARSPGTAAPYVTTPVQRFMFCYSSGRPYRGTAQSHYYVTQVFPPPAPKHAPLRQVCGLPEGTAQARGH
ncbi:MAG TPA: hypothetical protein VF730_17565 [Terracidiphilus sp.]